jgi:pyridoxine 5-phosphate synthase
MNASLNVNIDHVATVREARKTIEPSVIAAAMICEQAGADGITVHLRQDRRHIQDNDVRSLRDAVSTYLNLEIASTDEMVRFACAVKPDAVSLVPETPTEVTTEGGLDVAGNLQQVSDAIKRLKGVGIMVSVFIDPDEVQIEHAARAGADQIEICTAEYAFTTLGGLAHHESRETKASLKRIRSAVKTASSAGLICAAGHGITYRNVRPLADISSVTEFNIGHSIISRSIFAGLDAAVREMISAIKA